MSVDPQSNKWKLSASDLKQRQSLPLRMKLIHTLGVIHQWYESWDGEVALAFSGGKDSTVLLDIIRKIYPDVPAVFADTGLEYPEIRDFVKKQSNVTTVKPKKTFREIIKTYGVPVVSKKVSFMISMCQRIQDNNVNSRTLYMTGINSQGIKSGYTLPEKHKYLINAPFKISSRCCDFIKKEPLKRYEHETGRKTFVATMAADSRQRQNAYLKTGCNSFDSKTKLSRPLSIWTEQDVLQYCIDEKLEIAAIYGKIINTTKGLRCEHMDRTGCMFCLFGIHMEGKPNRFQKMAVSHPSQYRYCIENLELGNVMDFMNIDYKPITDLNHFSEEKK